MLLACTRKLPVLQNAKIKCRILAEKVYPQQTARQRKHRQISGHVLANLHRVGMCTPWKKVPSENRTNHIPNHPMARRISRSRAGDKGIDFWLLT